MISRIVLISLILLLPCQLLMGQSTEPLTLEDITADIKPGTLYPGSLVITAVEALVTMYEAEMETVAQEAKTEAVSIMTAEMERQAEQYAETVIATEAEKVKAEKRRDAWRTIAVSEAIVVTIVATIIAIILK